MGCQVFLIKQILTINQERSFYIRGFGPSSTYACFGGKNRFFFCFGKRAKDAINHGFYTVP